MASLTRYASRWPRWRAVAVPAAALLVAALTARLGFWQLDRAEQKVSLQSRIDGNGRLPPLPADALARDAAAAEAQHFRRIAVRGRWLPRHTVYLDNRQMNGRPGFIVVTPLLLATGDAVLVQRGWVARNFLDRTALPPLPTLAGPLDLSGRVAPPPARLLELGDAGSGAIRQNLDLQAFAAEIGVPLRPLSVQQTVSAATANGSTSDGSTADAVAPPGTAVDDGLLRQWPPVAVDVGKHYGYALQWFALCALTVGLYVWFRILRPRHG